MNKANRFLDKTILFSEIMVCYSKLYVQQPNILVI